MKVTILIWVKPGIPDPEGRELSNDLRQRGFAVIEARVGKVIDLEIELSDAERAKSEVEQMCKKLLAHPLIEHYEIKLP